MLGVDGKPISRMTLWRMRKDKLLPPRTLLNRRQFGTRLSLIDAMLAARTEKLQPAK
jgi:hypothetical protein